MSIRYSPPPEVAAAAAIVQRFINTPVTKKAGHSLS
jgi:hypothetical protein